MVDMIELVDKEMVDNQPLFLHLFLYILVDIMYWHGTRLRHEAGPGLPRSGSDLPSQILDKESWNREG